MDARRRDQAPGPGAAPHRDGPGRGHRAPGGPNGPGARFPIRASGLPGSARGARGSGEHAARGRPQRLPAARRHPARDPRAARHGVAHLAQARAGTAPKLARERAAHALGADLARLGGALIGAAPDTHAQPTETGLREDQAAAAIGERDLTGARDILAVIDARIRNRTGTFVPLLAGPWSARVPAIAGPERRAYVTQVAELMDARKKRLGEHAADSAPPWAASALGPVPEIPAARLDWQHRAASIAAWRELSGYHHPADPIGPEPAAAAPDLRAAWRETLAALGRAEGPDVRGMPDGMLPHLHDTYPVETAWAPQWVGDELRQVRDDHRQATREQERARCYRALEEAYRQRETVFAAVMTDRAEWEAATRQQRQLAVAADAELRRRHPGQYWAPVVGRAPAGHRCPACRAHADGGGGNPGDGPVDQGAGCGARTFADRLANRQSETIPSEDPGLRRSRPGVPCPDRTGKGADLAAAQARDPAIPAALERVMDRDADWEAAD